MANLESFSAAAKTIHLSQPSVTLAIRHLEGKVGAALFDRRQTGCYVTSAGAIFLPRVARMLSQIRQALYEPIVGQPFVDRSSVTALERKITDAQARGLIAISESVSFDEAARRIGVKEPSLHRSARTLERILRRTLYRRTAQGYTTTPPATELARRFKVAAREIEYGMDEIAAEHGPFVSRIVVGNIPIPTPICSPPRSANFSPSSRRPRSTCSTVTITTCSTPCGTAAWISCTESAAAEMGGRHRRTIPVLQSLRRRRAPRSPNSDASENNHLGSCALRLDHAAEGTPRRHAFEQIFKERKIQPKVSVETTSMGIYRALLGTSDRLSLFSHREVDADRTAGFEALPYRSPSLKRDDGIALRRDWKPTRIHLEFLERLAAFAAIRG